ncbi:hypothetical protein [Thermococcus sp.]
MRTAFVIAGLLIAIVSMAKVLINFEYEYLEMFGIFPVKTEPLAFLYLTLPYIFWSIGFVLTGFTLERLLNFRSARTFIWGLVLLPFTYGAFRFILALILNLSPYLAYSDLIRYSIITVFLIAMRFLAGYLVRKIEVPTVNE